MVIIQLRLLLEPPNGSNPKSDYAIAVENGVSLSTSHRVRRKEHDDDDGGVEQCHIWITDASLRRWLAPQEAHVAHSGNPAYVGWMKDRAFVIARRATDQGRIPG